MNPILTGAVLAALALAATSATASTVGPGGFDAGYASQITFDPNATRGTANDRDNALNALGVTDGKFFEIGLGSTIDLTFGTPFVSPGTLVEVTFGNPGNYPEAVKIEVGNAGDALSFVEINESPISNLLAQSPTGVSFTFGGGPFDVLRMTDVTPASSPSGGGFDLDSIRVTALPSAPPPVPLPASVLLLGSGLLGAAALRGRKRRG